MHSPNIPPIESPTLRRIQLLDEEWFEQFTRRFMEYGEGAADELGLAGQWGDLHRKVAKLKTELWKGIAVDDQHEEAREVLLDIIGHAFLAVDMIDRGITGGRGG